MASNRPVVYRSRINDIKALSTQRLNDKDLRHLQRLALSLGENTAKSDGTYDPASFDFGSEVEAAALNLFGRTIQQTVGQLVNGDERYDVGENPFTIAELDTQYSSVGAIDSIKPVTFDADSDGTVARFVDFSNSINLLEENFWIFADSDGHEHNMLGSVLDFGPEIPGNGGAIVTAPAGAVVSDVSLVNGFGFKTHKITANLESQNVGPADVSLVSGNGQRVSVLNGEVLSENAAIGDFTINRSYTFVLDVKSGSPEIFAKRGARSLSGDLRSNSSTTSGDTRRVSNSISANIVSDNCVTEIIGSLKWYANGNIESGISTASGNASYHQPPISGDVVSEVSTVQGRGGDRVTVSGLWSASNSQVSGAGIRRMKISGSVQPENNSLIVATTQLIRKASISIEPTESLVSGVSERKVVSTSASLESLSSFTSSETGRTVRGFGGVSASSSILSATVIIGLPYITMATGELYVEMPGTLYVRNVTK